MSFIVIINNEKSLSNLGCFETQVRLSDMSQRCEI